MMSNNKILTVSYGTFSCTLEGFDDSFGTMKAIAEYFRDLASDDRYFGAEPPQPDAQMLARIAQKEVSKRVQARERDGQIVLSAVEEHKSAAPQAAVATAGHLAQPDPVAPDVAAPPAPSANEAPAEEKPVIVESPDLLAETADIQPLQVETPVAPEPVAVEVDPAPTDIVPGQPDAEVEAFFEEASDNDAVETVTEEPSLTDEMPSVAETVSVVDTPAPDSIAAKLQRIRAVVAQHEEADDDEDYLEDEHAAAPAEPSVDNTDMLADARSDIENALAADNEDYLSDAAAEQTNADVLKILQQTDADDDDISAEDDLDDSIMAFDTEASLDAAEPIDNFFDEDRDADVTQLRADDSLLNADDTDDASAIEDDEAALPPRRPRVIKVRRAELDEAIENGDLEEYEDDPQPAQSATSLDELAPAKTAQRTLSPEDEDDLVKELAALEAGLDADHYEEDDSPDTTAEFDDDEDDDVEEPSSQIGRDGLPSIDEDPDSDINRLMAETDHQMGEPEGATRREAFAQLRAAVAAKKADTAISGDETKADDGEAYRDDLAEVVRPRRPVSGTSRTERPGGDRPAPLKLVAEQRIDVDKPRSAGPVRPRRVAAVVDTAPADPDAESFADYAADMGATKLPELLEAAAAYMSFVEGLDQFSRPQLMNTVRQAGPEEGFSREDGLRSFGQLLRSGKIEKIKGGRFTVSDDIGYQPDERAAG